MSQISANDIQNDILEEYTYTGTRTQVNPSYLSWI